MMPWRPWLISHLHRDCQALNTAIISPFIPLLAVSPSSLPPQHFRGVQSSFYSSVPPSLREDVKSGVFRTADFLPQVRLLPDHRLTLFPLAALHSAGEVTAYLAHMRMSNHSGDSTCYRSSVPLCLSHGRRVARSTRLSPQARTNWDAANLRRNRILSAQ